MKIADIAKMSATWLTHVRHAKWRYAASNWGNGKCHHNLTEQGQAREWTWAAPSRTLLAGACIALSPYSLAQDFTRLSWTTPTISRDAQNVITIASTVTNIGSTELRAKFSVRAGNSANSTSGATVGTPQGEEATIAAGSSQPVSVTVPTFPAGQTLFLCAQKKTDFGTEGNCYFPSDTASASATATAPSISSVYWAVQARIKTSATATEASVNSIDLSSLTANVTTSSAWLFRCYEQQSGGGTPPTCRLIFTLSDNTMREINSAIGTEVSIYFRGADNNGNLKVCAGVPWTSSGGCRPLWSDGRVLALKSIKVALDAGPSTTVTVARNIPPPPLESPILSMSAPVMPITVSSGGILPSVTFTVSRQPSSIAPSSTHTCTAMAPNPLGYSCIAGGNITTQTSATCVCTPSSSAPNAPTVTASTNYAVTATASANGATLDPATNPATATLTVQPVSGNRGCTDDPTVPIIRDIDFATTASFNRENYPFSTVGDNITNPPSVAAIKLIVTPGGGIWASGSLQIGPAINGGSSGAEAVISRCKGRFDAGGREKVIRLNGYFGSENQSGVTFFANWVVDPVGAPNIYTARLNSPGLLAPDGWLSDGVYYVNTRQTYCSAGAGGTCVREIVGTGGSN